MTKECDRQNVPAGVPPTEPPIVLVAGAEDRLRQEVAGILRGARMCVRETPSGRECLALALSGQVAAVLLDVLLTDDNGIAVLRWLHLLLPAIPVILFTGVFCATARLLAGELGAAGYLAGPLHPGSLLKLMQPMLVGTSAAEGGVP